MEAVSLLLHKLILKYIVITLMLKYYLFLEAEIFVPELQSILQAVWYQ